MVKCISIGFTRVSSFAVPCNSIGNQLYMCTQVSLEERTDEILNQIYSSGVGSSPSRDELCIGFIRKVCASGNLLFASRVLKAFRRKNIPVGLYTYNVILEAADSRNDYGMLSEVFKDLLVSCTSIRLNSYLIIGRAFGKHRNPSVLLDFINDICELELPRIDVVLNRIIFAFAKCGHVDSAFVVFDHMKSCEYKPDLVAYNTILAILGRLGRVDNMLREFSSMKAVDLIPDVVTYNTMLNCLRKMGRLDLCLVYYKEMIERGIQPDLMTFKPLIEALGRSGNIEDAMKVFQAMQLKHMVPSIYIYRALVFSLKRMGKLDLATKFSTEMNRIFPQNVIRNFHHNTGS